MDRMVSISVWSDVRRFGAVFDARSNGVDGDFGRVFRHGVVVVEGGKKAGKPGRGFLAIGDMLSWSCVLCPEQ